MSNNWISTVYFKPFDIWPSDLALLVTQKLAADGLDFPLVAKDSKMFWTSASGAEVFEVSELSQALDLSATYNGGHFKLVNLENLFEMQLGLFCCSNKLALATSAEAHFGHITFSVDYGNLHDENPNLIADRYKRIYRWSTTLSSVQGVIYGWGDLTQSLMNVLQAVSAEDIQNRRIPRVSRWTFYDKEYLSWINNKAITSGAWACYEDDYGLTSFLYPPLEINHPLVNEMEWLKVT